MYRVLHMFPTPNYKMECFFFNKELNFTAKFSMVGVLSIVSLPQNFCASISKIVDFFLMSNFLVLVKANDKQKLDKREKSTNFKIKSPIFFLQVFNTPKPNYTKFERKKMPFRCLILSLTLVLCDWLSWN